MACSNVQFCVLHSQCDFLVPVVGIEPTRGRPHRILSPARLPVPPHRRTDKKIAQRLTHSQPARSIGQLRFAMSANWDSPLHKHKARIPPSTALDLCHCILYSSCMRTQGSEKERSEEFIYSRKDSSLRPHHSSLPVLCGRDFSGSIA